VGTIKLSEILGVEEEGCKDAEGIVKYYGGDMLFRRWLATFIDFAFLVSLFFFSLGVNKYLGDKYYNKTSFIWSILGTSLIICYYFIQEAITGYTIGKYILRIKVVDINFAPPGFKKSLIRNLIRLIEINPLLLGGLPAGIAVIESKKNQRIGDRVAKTYVLKCCDIKKQSNLPIKKNIALIIGVCTILAAIVGGMGAYSSIGKTIISFDNKNKDIISTDKELQITCPSSWDKRNEAMFFRNSNEVKLYAVNSKGQGSIKIIKETTNKINRNIDPKEYVKIVEKYNGVKCTLSSTAEPKVININSYTAIQFEMIVKYGERNSKELITIIQTPDNVYTLLCESFGNVGNIDELYKISNSFTERKFGK